jgi:phenylalanyl-tRNA synthetase beta chain
VREEMRVPLSWLNEFVELHADVEEIANRLEMAGFSVEAVERIGDDFVLNIEVTPNRGDCLSVEGIAREVAAIFNAPFKSFTPSVSEEADEIDNHVNIRVEEEAMCPRYSARLISGVTVGESPEWLRKRLIACGQMPINNVVDITNYVMFGFGQPLHAFDFEKIEGATIIVRRAREGEKIVTLDGVERTLSNDMLVIADIRKPVAIAGVMGGLDSEVTEHTKVVLLESAHFHKSSIRRTAKQLGMRTEASYRFERWVDPNGTVRALDIAAELIARLAGGKVHKGVIDIYPSPIEPRKIKLRIGRARKILGVDVSVDEAESLLRRLGLSVCRVGDETISVEAPTWRNDLEQETDLIEEIARLYNYERIPATLPKGVSERSGESELRKIELRCKELLTRLGLSEVVTFSLTNSQVQASFNFEDHGNAVWVRNPLSREYCMLRTNILPSLLSILEHNLRRGVSDVWMFEIGKVYSIDERTLQHEERRQLGIVITGSAYTSTWNMPREMTIADFYSLKGIVEELLKAIGVSDFEFVRASHPAFHPYQACNLIIGGEVSGILGRIHPDVEREHDFRNPVYAAQIDFEKLAKMYCHAKAFKQLPIYPAVTRDVAFVVSEDVEAGSIVRAIIEVCGELVESVTPFDEYRSEQLGHGFKSIAFSVTLRAHDRTLSGEEVEQVMERVRQVVCERFNARVRI